MKTHILTSIIALTFLVLTLNFATAVIVDSNFITIFPGEEGRIILDVENNNNFDIEDVSIALELGGKKVFNSLGILVEETENLPFLIIRGSEKEVDDLDEDDDDTVSFTIRAFTDITPGDYNIPYTIKFVNADNDEDLEETGSFGLRVSAKTEIDFVAEVNEKAIVNEEGRITLEIINKGLGDIKSVSVQIFPSGFELLSKDKIFIGTVNSDDTDIASFDVVYKSSNPSLSARVEYKDFDNEDQTQTVNLPLNVYTKEKALELGLIQKSKTGIYITIAVVLLVAWIIYRRIKKRRKNKGR